MDKVQTRIESHGLSQLVKYWTRFIPSHYKSIVITLDDGEDIEFTREDLASIGIDANKAIEVIKSKLLERFV
ncbi:MAG: hypothetical protein ACI8XV_002888 [Arenicella sp.]|jgi:hypothetical protein